MALTKPNFYLVAIALMVLIFSGIGIVGTVLVDNDRLDLDIDSVDYVLEVKGVNSQSGYDTIANTTSAESQQGNILDSSDDSQVSDSNDFLSTLYIKKERASAPTNFFKLVYNMPSSLLGGLGLDVGDWTNYINIISFLLFIAILIMIWTKLVNT